MKTQPMEHQREALVRMNGRESYALFMEQGTGKTWALLADAERMYAAGKIDGLLVLAPNGVHTNWIKREIPTHLDAACVAVAWDSGMGKRKRQEIERKLFAPREEGEVPPLRVLAMSYDAVNTDAGFTIAQRFLNATRSMLACDESQRIKNPSSLRTKRVMRLRTAAVARRIATGTPVANRPVDVFAQMEFLESGLLGTTSYRAFVAEYSELVPADSPMMQRMIARNPKAAFAQIIARDPVTDMPLYRNLDKLAARLAPHSFRVLKADCLDLPEKIYKTHFFDMTAQQQKAYELMRRELRIAMPDGDEETVHPLAELLKLQQITSGFVMSNGKPVYVPGSNPRLAALMDLIEDIDGKAIIWCRFQMEILHVSRALRDAGHEVVEYHGGTKKEDRNEAIDSIQSGTARFFVGNAQSGGTGITLTGAATVIYYSNDFNLETRQQSEDRAHRIGQTRNVVYIDLVATGTVDERIAVSLQVKAGTARKILRDEVRQSER